MGTFASKLAALPPPIDAAARDSDSTTETLESIDVHHSSATSSSVPETFVVENTSALSTATCRIAPPKTTFKLPVPAEIPTGPPSSSKAPTSSSPKHLVLPTFSPSTAIRSRGLAPPGQLTEPGEPPKLQRTPLASGNELYYRAFVRKDPVLLLGEASSRSFTLALAAKRGSFAGIIPTNQAVPQGTFSIKIKEKGDLLSKIKLTETQAASNRSFSTKLRNTSNASGERFIPAGSYVPSRLNI